MTIGLIPRTCSSTGLIRTNPGRQLNRRSIPARFEPQTPREM